MKKKLGGLLAVVLVVVGIVWFVRDDVSHIEDTNGPEDHSLQTITEENIVKMDMGSIGGPTISRGILTGDTVTFSGEKFTGVYEVLYDNFILPSDFQVDLSAYEIQGGNFQMVIVHEDQIVATLQPDLMVTYRLEDVTGTVSLRIVGESAAFRFDMTQFDYDMHTHAE